jgi:group I intron endonuclease
MIIYSIYRIVNRLNGKCYIGHTQDFKKRMSDHLANSKRKNTHLYKAIKKVGWENFDKHIIYQSLDLNYCKNIMENYFITEYDSYNKGYNLTFGGDGCTGPKTEIAKKKMSLAKKGKTTVKDKFGNTYHIYKNDPRFISGELVGIQKGVKLSPETIEKYKIRSKGNQARLGIPHSEEIKKIISERTSDALKGKPKNIVACPHCGKSGGQGNMKRYHFEFCKSKN